MIIPKKNNILWNEELEQQKNTKQKAYQRYLNTKNPNDKATYKRGQSGFKNMVNKNKNDTWDRKYKQVDSYLGGTRSTEA